MNEKKIGVSISSEVDSFRLLRDIVAEIVVSLGRIADAQERIADATEAVVVLVTDAAPEQPEPAAEKEPETNLRKFIGQRERALDGEKADD